MEQADFATGRLAATLVGLLRNDECLARMRAASLRLGRPNATKNVAERLMRLVNRPRNQRQASNGERRPQMSGVRN